MGNYGAPGGGLASTGLAGITVAGLYMPTPVVAGVAFGLVAIGAVMVRLSFRRGRSVSAR